MIELATLKPILEDVDKIVRLYGLPYIHLVGSSNKTLQRHVHKNFAKAIIRNELLNTYGDDFVDFDTELVEVINTIRRRSKKDINYIGKAVSFNRALDKSRKAAEFTIEELVIRANDTIAKLPVDSTEENKKFRMLIDLKWSGLVKSYNPEAERFNACCEVVEILATISDLDLALESIRRIFPMTYKSLGPTELKAYLEANTPNFI